MIGKVGIVWVCRIRSGGGGATSAKSTTARGREEAPPERRRKPAEKPAAPRPAPAAAPQDDAKADPAPAERPSNVTEKYLTIPLRKPIVPAGQPPAGRSPSANEISPEALAKQSEVEKHAKRLTLMELTERTCQMAHRRPGHGRLLYFCGLPVQQGKP